MLHALNAECFLRFLFHLASAPRRLVKASKKRLVGAIYKEKKKGEIKAKRVLDNLRMSKVQEISTSVAIVCHPFERLNILQNDFAIIRLRARKDYEKLFK